MVRPLTSWVALTLASLGTVATVVDLACYDAAGWPGGAAAAISAAVTALTWLATGLVTAVARPRLPFGWLLVGGGVCLALGGMFIGWGALEAVRLHRDLGGWLTLVGTLAFFPHLGMNVAIYLLFPAGRLPSPRWRPWMVLTVAANATLLFAQLTAPTLLTAKEPLKAVPNPAPHPAWTGALQPFAVAGMDLAFLAGLAALWVRLRQAESADRPVVRWVLGFAVFNLAVGLLLVVPPGPWVYALAVPATACMTVSVMVGLIRHRLWNVRETIGRAVGYVLLTGVVVLVFTGTTALANTAFGSRAGTAGVPVAALIVCLGLTLLQPRIQVFVDRLAYGRRRQPYAVLSALGAALETAGEPTEALGRLAATAATVLKLPSVSVVLAGRTVAHHGAAADTDRTLSLPLHHHGTDLGELVVGLRGGEAAFSAADRRLLDDLARQAGATAHSAWLTDALRVSRERLVTVREAERRRLRRDLHDGVASALTAIGLTVDVAASAIPDDPRRGTELVGRARQDIAATLDEVRRVIDGLGPAALADHGLAGALADLARQFTGNGRTVTADIRPEAFRTSAAVEVAAYRITTEALHNVVKHADASRCDIILTASDGRLELTITDDGRGLDVDHAPGIGLISMAERAEEVGGHLTVRRGERRGTVVAVTLPHRDEGTDEPAI